MLSRAAVGFKPMLGSLCDAWFGQFRDVTQQKQQIRCTKKAVKKRLAFKGRVYPLVAPTDRKPCERSVPLFASAKVELILVGGSIASMPQELREFE
jgi:hypothetical protein